MPRKPSGRDENDRVLGVQVIEKLVVATRFATDAITAITALPVASLAATSGTAVGIWSTLGGKVTPVRYEHGQQDGSGQEEDAEHFCSRLDSRLKDPS